MIKTGVTFGRLTVLFPAHVGKNYQRYYLVQCSCGREKTVRGDALKIGGSGGTLSCGCLQREIVSAKGNHYRKGTRFGRLSVIKELGTDDHGMQYLCKCKCGKTCKVAGRTLACGDTKSCGCFYKESRVTANFRHGKSPSGKKIAVYSAYHHAKSSCENPNDKFYSYCGGRGVLFCFDSFQEFYAAVGDRPDDGYKYRLRRIDTEKNYVSDNLSWIRNKKQSLKKRKTS